MFNRSVQTKPEPAQDDMQVGTDLHSFDEIAGRDALDFETLHARHKRQLEMLNTDIARVIPDGAIVAAPLCSTACNPGPLADFLLMLRLDPFGPDNMRFAPANPQTAVAFEAPQYCEEIATHLDKEMTSFCKRALAAWEDFKSISPDANTIDVFNQRDTLRALIAQAAERLSDRIEDEAPCLSEACVIKRTKLAA